MYRYWWRQGKGGGGIKREIGINDEDLSLEYVEFEG